MVDSVRSVLLVVGGIASFTGRFFKNFYRPPYEFREMVHQAYALGYRSLFLVGITGLIIGIVMTLQLRPAMEQFGAESWLPSMTSLSIIKEIGPVVTALICAGKLASGIGAELGTMRVTDQIDAMEVSGVRAFNYLIVTRVIATTSVVPLLVIYSDAIALLGSFMAVNLHMDMSFTLFLTEAIDILSFQDVWPSVIKTFFFGFAIGIVGCFKGYYTKGGTSGVGEAANASVVVASIFIFFIDLLAVQIAQLFV
jgi:phospholipid/cholesterol/gamma-HCH transport system permease protein